MRSDLPPPPPQAPAGSAATTDGFAEPRRLHPASIVLGLRFVQTVQAFLVPTVAAVAAGGTRTLGILGVIAAVSAVGRVLHWQRFTFFFDGEVLRVDSGVLGRSHRSLDVARIQQVEIDRGPVQRALGLATLRVETAGSASEPEVELRVLEEAEAVALRDAVRASKARLTDRTESTAEERPSRTILEVPLSHVALAAVTGARLLVLPAVIGGVLQLVGQQFEQFAARRLRDVVQRQLTLPGDDLVGAGPDWSLVVLGAVAAVVLAAIAAIAVGMVREGRFRIERVGDDLHVSRGIVSTRESVVPLRRVQLVELHRNWIRRLLRVGTVRIRSAGGSAGGAGRVAVPLIRDEHVDALLMELLPGVEGVPALVRHPTAARRRALFRWLRPPVIAAAVLWAAPELLPFDVAFLEPVRWAVTASIPVSAVLAVVEYGQLAHALTDRVVVSRRGALSISTTLAPVVKVQAVTSRRSLFQRRLGLTTLVAHVAGPSAHLEVLDADAGDARELHAALTEHAAAPIPRPVGTAASVGAAEATGAADQRAG